MMHFIRELSLQLADEQDYESPRRCEIVHSKADYKSFKFANDTKALKMDSPTGAEVANGSYERKKIYIKKNVVDSLLPEIVGFFENNNYHFVQNNSGDIEAHCKDTCTLGCCKRNNGIEGLRATSEGETRLAPCLQEARRLANADVALDDSEAYRSAKASPTPSAADSFVENLHCHRRSISSLSGGSASSSGSFAFPTLSAEWPGTPPRMPRADRGYWQRHNEWRKNLLCCKF